MEKRLIAFVALSVVLITAQSFILRWVNGPPKRRQVAQQKAPADAAAADQKAAEAAPPAEGADAAVEANAEPMKNEAGEAAATDNGAPQMQAPAEESVEREFVTLGSADPASPYRMVVTLTNQGAAVDRIELNAPRYRALEQENPGGYLGYLAAEPEVTGRGLLVRAVAPGTPAALAGLAVGDVLVEVAGAPVVTAAELDHALATKTEPGQRVSLTIERAGASQKLDVALVRPPLALLHGEAADPLSFLLTLAQVDGQTIAKDGVELDDVKLRETNWKVVRGDDEHTVAFQRDLASFGLRVIKRFQLTTAVVAPPNDRADPKAEAAAKAGAPSPGYDLVMEVTIENLKPEQARTVAYLLDGPTGLPIEGHWFASKISHTWGGTGIRDVVVGFRRGEAVVDATVSAMDIAAGKLPAPWIDEPIAYVGVDAQYFSVVMIPQGDAEKQEPRFSRAVPLRVGPVPVNKADHKLTNTSFRLVSAKETLGAERPSLTHRYRVFAGPKKSDILEHYALADLNYYGWFGWVSRPMLALLHGFYHLVGNYGLAIIMLTVLVRSAVFPLSRSQVKNAEKMKELQPELKRIADKFKNDMEGRARAQQALFAKHKYHPMAGCLPVFIQLPVFVGLYRSLSVDVELRQAPLFGESVHWCSNLAAPDMLFRWDSFMPVYLQSWFGPFFNFLPLVTVALFLVQQKMFMPPPNDEQARVQQQTMQFMTLFMGVMFFKVASGLCLYFIASSLWGLAERKFFLRTSTGTSPTTASDSLTPSAGGNGFGGAAQQTRTRK